MLKKKEYKFWFCTGSQDLYGDECLAHVAEHAKIIVEKLNESGVLPYEVVWKPTLITNELIRKTFNEANIDDECAGVITWMHTFSPAKSWILGLQEFRKPLLHLHTQFNMEIPYDTIDMDFMNENQSAHGGREFGHIFTRLGIERKVVVGHWSDEKVQEKIASWMRTAVGVTDRSHSHDNEELRQFFQRSKYIRIYPKAHAYSCNDSRNDKVQDEHWKSSF